MPTYRVVAGYVTVETAVPGGRAEIDIPRGALLPADVPAEQRERLLRLGAIEQDSEIPAESLPPPPPRRGTGSGIDAWAAYATAYGIPVPDGYGRDQVREMLALAGVPVD